MPANQYRRSGGTPPSSLSLIARRPIGTPRSRSLHRIVVLILFAVSAIVVQQVFAHQRRPQARSSAASLPASGPGVGTCVTLDASRTRVVAEVECDVANTGTVLAQTARSTDCPPQTLLAVLSSDHSRVICIGPDNGLNPYAYPISSSTSSVP